MSQHRSWETPALPVRAWRGGGGTVLKGRLPLCPLQALSLKCLEGRLPQLTRAASTVAATPAPTPALAAPEALVEATAAGSRPGPLLRPQLTSPLAAAAGTACQ